VALPFLAAAAAYAVNAWRVKGLLVSAASIGYYRDEITQALQAYFDSESAGAFVTDKVNARLADAGLSLRFSNVFDKDKLRDDLDRFAAERVNAKAGTNFVSLKKIDKEGFLVGVSQVLAERVNTETGSKIQALWPVERLRSELGTELVRQFDSGADLAPGALFDRASVAMVQAKLAKKLGSVAQAPNVPGDASPGTTFWGPPRDERHALERAKARVRAAKYRRKHRQVWVKNSL
jgi:hypothetical protein